MLALHFDTGIAVVAAHHGIGHQLHLFADFVEAASHEALDRVDGILGVGDGLALGHLADQPLAAFGEPNHRRRRAAAFLVRDDDRLAAFHDGNNGVGGPEVDADDFSHTYQSSGVY